MSRSRSSSAPPRDGAAAAGLELPAYAGPTLLRLARAAIAAELGLTLPVDTTGAWLQQRAATFVTLQTRGELSGCIGTITPVRSLLEDVQGNARAAAFHDRRFPRLVRADLDATSVEVSVLSAVTPFVVTGEADALARLRPGVDGLVLSYAGRRATFLPRVWDRLPDPARFLSQLKLKLGVPPTWWSEDLSLARYTVSEFSEGALR